MSQTNVDVDEESTMSNEYDTYANLAQTVNNMSQPDATQIKDVKQLRVVMEQKLQQETELESSIQVLTNNTIGAHELSDVATQLKQENQVLRVITDQLKELMPRNNEALANLNRDQVDTIKALDDLRRHTKDVEQAIQALHILFDENARKKPDILSYFVAKLDYSIKKKMSSQKNCVSDTYGIVEWTFEEWKKFFSNFDNCMMVMNGKEAHEWISRVLGARYKKFLSQKEWSYMTKHRGQMKKEKRTYQTRCNNAMYVCAQYLAIHLLPNHKYTFAIRETVQLLFDCLFVPWWQKMKKQAKMVKIENDELFVTLSHVVDDSKIELGQVPLSQVQNQNTNIEISSKVNSV